MEEGGGHQSLASRGRSVSAGSREGTGFPPLPRPGSHTAVPHITARGRTTSRLSASLQSPLCRPFVSVFFYFSLRQRKKKKKKKRREMRLGTTTLGLSNLICFARPGAMKVTFRAKSLVEDGRPFISHLLINSACDSR